MMEIYIIVSLTLVISSGVFLMFYRHPTNTTVLTHYILMFHPFSKKPQTDHKGRTTGVPEIRAPPPKIKGFTLILSVMQKYKIRQKWT